MSCDFKKRREEVSPTKLRQPSGGAEMKVEVAALEVFSS